MTRQELSDFIQGKLIEAASSLHKREQMAKAWSSGTDAEWEAASKIHISTIGMVKTKSERKKEAQMHTRIAEKLKIQVQAFSEVHKILSE